VRLYPKKVTKAKERGCVWEQESHGGVQNPSIAKKIKQMVNSQDHKNNKI
jgi:hypothetical protein